MSSAMQYMLDNTDAFIAKVFEGNQSYIDSCAGMVSAHGDKVAQYRDHWERQCLDYKKAQIIYFLTFTKLMGETPKHLSCEWVVDNYDLYAKYLP